MAKELISDALWAEIEPLLPPAKTRRFYQPGRKPLDRRKVLTGILFVLKSGLPWQMLPQEMGCGSGMSCWRYLRDRKQAGGWDRIHQLLLAKLREADKIDFSRAVVDSSYLRAVLGEETGPNPTDRRKLGSKHHLITDARGIPLVLIATRANRHDIT